METIDTLPVRSKTDVQAQPQPSDVLARIVGQAEASAAALLRREEARLEQERLAAEEAARKAREEAEKKRREAAARRQRQAMFD